MATEQRTQEILQALNDAVFSFDEDRTVTLTQTALNEGVDPFVAVLEGLSAGMNAAGEAYARRKYFVPELLLCADALKAGLNILKPAIESSGRQAEIKGSIVLGVVEGDLHDIGKNLVKLMFEVAGWQVYDLGKDVPIDRFAEEQQRTSSDLVGLSAMMTTSMLNMPDIIDRIRKNSLKVQILVGGAPLNAELALRFGADGYATTAVSAVSEGTRLLKAH